VIGSYNPAEFMYLASISSTMSPLIALYAFFAASYLKISWNAYYNWIC